MDTEFFVQNRIRLVHCEMDAIKNFLVITESADRTHKQLASIIFGLIKDILILMKDYERIKDEKVALERFLQGKVKGE